SARPDVIDASLLAATRLSHPMLTLSFFLGELGMYAWLSLEALRIWLEHGPSPTLLGTATGCGAAAALRGDYVAGYRALRRILAVGEARGYEPETSRARFRFAHVACWVEPIENAADAVKRAREGLIAGGDVSYAGYAYHAHLFYLFDYAPLLANCVDEA